MIRCRVIRGMDLDRIVAAATQPVDILVRQMRRQLRELRILVEKVFAVESAVGRRQRLKFAIHRFVKCTQQKHLRVAREEGIPIGAPQQLDHVPACAGEQPFEFLNDRTIAAHRAVEPLQVAVDNEDQVIKAFACGDRQSRKRLGLVHLSVAHEGPYLALPRIEQRPVLQVAQETRVVDRKQRTDPHRARRKLPEARHQPWMWVRAQAAALRFAPIVIKLLRAQSPFEKCTRINAGR